MTPATVGADNRGAPRSGISLLDQSWVAEMLELLSVAPHDAGEVERKMSRDGLSPRRGLRRLVETGLVTSLPGARPPARRLYALAPPGADLLELSQALDAWLATLPSKGTESGLRRLVARREARLVLRTLAEGPLAFVELQRRVPGLSAGTLDRALGNLRELGAVRVEPLSTPGHPRYQLTDAARRLGRVAVLTARWRWRWAADVATPDAGDLPGLVQLIAPLARAPRNLDGGCQLAVEPARHWQQAEPLAVWMRVAGARLSTLALPPVAEVQTRLAASAPAWCDALLSGSVEGIQVFGDRSLAEAVVEALARVLASC